MVPRRGLLGDRCRIAKVRLRKDSIFSRLIASHLRAGSRAYKIASLKNELGIMSQDVSIIDFQIAVGDHAWLLGVVSWLLQILKSNL